MFSPQSSIQAQPELIPAATLVKCLLVCKDTKTSNNSGASYTDVELRVCEGEFEGRVIFDMIMNPFDPKASEGGKRMGILALTRIGEAIGMFEVSKPESYERYSDPKTSIFDVLGDIDGTIVAVKTKIEKGKDGHPDRNKVAEWLTPNPNSGSGFKGWTDLQAGNTGNPPERAAAFGGGASRQNPNAAKSGQPDWLKKPNE